MPIKANEIKLTLKQSKMLATSFISMLHVILLSLSLQPSSSFSSLSLSLSASCLSQSFIWAPIIKSSCSIPHVGFSLSFSSTTGAAPFFLSCSCSKQVRCKQNGTKKNVQWQTRVSRHSLGIATWLHTERPVGFQKKYWNIETKPLPVGTVGGGKTTLLANSLVTLAAKSSISWYLERNFSKCD